ncbi:hypothetical protein J6590_026429 [Homalodisca vitripennis]|nr:hypothetical protein J6590_026429 [Homalodisca vitripennis]
MIDHLHLHLKSFPADDKAIYEVPLWPVQYVREIGLQSATGILTILFGRTLTPSLKAVLRSKTQTGGRAATEPLCVTARQGPPALIYMAAYVGDSVGHRSGPYMGSQCPCMPVSTARPFKFKFKITLFRKNTIYFHTYTFIPQGAEVRPWAGPWPSVLVSTARPLTASARVYRPAFVPVSTARPLAASARYYRPAFGRQCPCLPPGLWSPVPVSTARPLVASARDYRPAFGRQCQ